MTKEYRPVRFTSEEARAKVGCRVRSVAAIDEIAAGTLGRVMQVDMIDDSGFDLIIEWDASFDGKRQHDWFNKEDFEQCLVEEQIQGIEAFDEMIDPKPNSVLS